MAALSTDNGGKIAAHCQPCCRPYAAVGTGHMLARRAAEGLLRPAMLLQAASAGMQISIEWRLAQISWLLIAVQAAVRPGVEYVS